MMFSKRTVLQLFWLMVLFMLLAAQCGGGAAPAAQPVPEQRVAEAEKVAQEQAQPAAQGVEVRFMVAATAQETEILQDQLRRFEEQSGIRAVLEVIPYVDFNEKLLTSIAAGVPPDIAALSYNFVAELQTLDSLTPLEQIGPIEREDFLDDALNSNTFNGQLYGLAWRRSACLPHFRNLALFQASKNPEAAFSLIDFLTQQEQQRQNFEGLGIFPTRRSVYGELALECPPVEAIRLTPEEVSITIGLVSDRLIPALEGVLEGQILNRYEATSVFENGQLQGAGAPLINPIPKEEFEERLTQGVVIGALLVEAAPEYPPGPYAVKCVAEREIPCFLVNPDGSVVEIPPEHFLGARDAEGPVDQPATVVERGSRIYCYYIDSRRYCFRVG